MPAIVIWSFGSSILSGLSACQTSNASSHLFVQVRSEAASTGPTSSGRLSGQLFDDWRSVATGRRRDLFQTTRAHASDPGPLWSLRRSCSEAELRREWHRSKCGDSGGY
ncbi:hypothetical protein NEOLEDRAFT_749614 [Neolentinus lepideus HHB14362 ss-1]|uniref:Secreted protein n=1 Tax=Neolentinus lepideus HHB14362 ss-1 TaxID=1314782 RepID=A0A165PTS0_9AGAM|nr:hypothetical protein NEOLEDRAFT_749614 [Neolentinus lepideus HHB14362 ss-1]